MGIVIPVPVERAQLAQILERRGWHPVMLNGRPAYEKVEGIWVWLARIEPQPEFISWVAEESLVHRHTEGVRQLQKEVDAIAEELGVRRTASITLQFGR